MKAITSLAAIAIAFFTFASCNSEKTNNRQTADSLNTVKAGLSNSKALEVSKPEAEFATRAAAAGITKLALSKLAIEKTANAQIKSFAESLIVDLENTNAELRTIAKDKKITLPKALDELHQKMWTDLKTKPSKEFDKAYLLAMANGQDQTQELLEKALPEIKDNELKDFALRYLQKSNAQLAVLKSITQ